MSDNTSPTVFCVSSSLALFLHPDLGLTGFFTQSWDLLVSSPSLGLTGFFTQLGTYWFLVSSPSLWDLLVPSPRLGTYWFLVSSLAF